MMGPEMAPNAPDTAKGKRLEAQAMLARARTLIKWSSQLLAEADYQDATEGQHER